MMTTTKRYIAYEAGHQIGAADRLDQLVTSDLCDAYDAADEAGDDAPTIIDTTTGQPIPREQWLGAGGDETMTKRPACECCGEPAGEGGALCPACQASRDGGPDTTGQEDETMTTQTTTKNPLMDARAKGFDSSYVFTDRDGRLDVAICCSSCDARGIASENPAVTHDAGCPNDGGR